MRTPRDWIVAAVVVALLTLGVALPLWLEYRALRGAGQDAEPAPLRSFRPRDSFFCPLCGHELSLGLFRLVPLRADAAPPRLFVSTVAAAPRWPPDERGWPRQEDEIHD